MGNWSRVDPNIEPELSSRGDPFAYGRKKSKEAGFGTVDSEYLKRRNKEYRDHGIGNPLSVGLSDSASKQLKPGSYKILKPKSTKKGTVYVLRKTKITKPKPVVTHKRGFEELKPALKYVNNIARETLNPNLYKITDNHLDLDAQIDRGHLKVNISHSPNAAYLKKYVVKLSISQ